MGPFEAKFSDFAEGTVRYHSSWICVLTLTHESGQKTFPVGQFDWGGRLPKSNGGAQRFPQAVWKSAVECKSIRELDCERDISIRCESRL